VEVLRIEAAPVEGGVVERDGRDVTVDVGVTVGILCYDFVNTFANNWRFLTQM
jgi:hypothetical protein